MPFKIKIFLYIENKLKSQFNHIQRKANCSNISNVLLTLNTCRNRQESHTSQNHVVQKPYNKRNACLYITFCSTKAQCYDHAQQEETSVLVHCPPAHSPCRCYITAAVTKAIVFPACQGSLHYQDLYACLGTVTHIHGWTLAFNWACDTTSSRCQMKL